MWFGLSGFTYAVVISLLNVSEATLNNQGSFTDIK